MATKIIFGKLSYILLHNVAMESRCEKLICPFNFLCSNFFFETICDKNKKAWFLGRIIRALPELLLVELHYPGLADNMVTCWSGTSSFACHGAGSSVCPRHIKLLPYTCQECLGHCHLFLPCSLASVFLL